jgi:hypothetical protein
MDASKIALAHDSFRTRVTSSFDSNAYTRKASFKEYRKPSVSPTLPQGQEPGGIPMLSRIFLAIFANCGPISSCMRFGGSR